MRGPRSLLVLLVIALGLGGYVYFVESGRDLTDPATKKAKVFDVGIGKVAEIDIRSASGESTTLKKQSGEWQITAPITAAADQNTVATLASSIEMLEVQKPLDENPASMVAFGLEPARFSIGFKTEGDDTAHRLDVGNKTATGSDLYARIAGQPRVFLIAGFNEDTFDRATFDLRDKTVLKFSRDETDTIRLDVPGQPAVALARKNGDWRLAEPLDAAADITSIDNVLNRASQVQLKAIVAGDAGAPTDAQLKSFGLDKPALVATFGAGSNRAALAIGGKKDDATRYARDLSKPLVFTVEDTLLADLRKAPADFRVKDIFTFKSFTADHLEITRDGKTTEFTKSKAPGTDTAVPDVWKQTKPDAKDVNQTAITDLLNTLSSLRAETFDAKAPAAGDDVVVLARSAGGPSEERVTFRKTGAVVRAIKANEAGAAVISAADFQKAMDQLGTVTSAK